MTEEYGTEIEELANKSDTKSEVTKETIVSSEDISEPAETDSAGEKNELGGNTAASDDAVNYEKIIAEDLALLRSEFPELGNISDITELDNPLRYAALRDLGLSPAEAYKATSKRAKSDNRSHLTAAFGKKAATPRGIMSSRELAEARELFSDLSDSEIQRLYRAVTS